MLKDTKSLGNNKAPACESRGFVLKKKKVRILTHLLFLLIIKTNISYKTLILKEAIVKLKTWYSMKAYNTTSYRFLFVVASRGIEPLSKV